MQKSLSDENKNRFLQYSTLFCKHTEFYFLYFIPINAILILMGHG